MDRKAYVLNTTSDPNLEQTITFNIDTKPSSSFSDMFSSMQKSIDKLNSKVNLLIDVLGNSCECKCKDCHKVVSTGESCDRTVNKSEITSIGNVKKEQIGLDGQLAGSKSISTNQSTEQPGLDILNQVLKQNAQVVARNIHSLPTEQHFKQEKQTLEENGVLPNKKPQLLDIKDGAKNKRRNSEHKNKIVVCNEEAWPIKLSSTKLKENTTQKNSRNEACSVELHDTSNEEKRVEGDKKIKLSLNRSADGLPENNEIANTGHAILGRNSTTVSKEPSIQELQYRIKIGKIEHSMCSNKTSHKGTVENSATSLVEENTCEGTGSVIEISFSSNEDFSEDITEINRSGTESQPASRKYVSKDSYLNSVDTGEQNKAIEERVVSEKVLVDEPKPSNSFLSLKKKRSKTKTDVSIFEQLAKLQDNNNSAEEKKSNGRSETS